MFGFGPATRIYLAAGATDMRKGFEGLYGLVRDRLLCEPLSGHLFLFCNAQRNRLKVLVWDGSGLWVEDAQKMQAGMHPLKVQNEQQQEELDRQNVELQAQKEALEKQQAALIQQQKQIEANKVAIAANTAKFGQLDDYYVWDEVTVLFGNGKVKVDPKDEATLLALAEKAKTVNGYVIEVTGYASSAGSVQVNQKFSEERAQNVTNVLLQKGHVPLPRILAPGAMGEAHQVGNAKTAERQAENRRVVVRVLQNKAIAGI